MITGKFINGALKVEKLNVIKITKTIKTPFYIYSKKNIEQNYKNFFRTFKSVNPLICFSVKANSNLGVLKILKRLGCGADVVSGGELLKALKSGINPNKIVFSGVGKSDEEIDLAIKKRILLINVESESEANLINKISKRNKIITRIGIRLNPDISAATHRKISTGKADDKFGLTRKKLISFCDKIYKLKNLKLEAISVHIGSQILSDKPFKRILKVLEDVMADTNIFFKYVDLGGGFGIPYNSKEKKINIRNYSYLVKKFQKKFNCQIIFEPGRAIVGNTGMLISKIQYLKEGKNKIFVILDAGMNDFMRPALYDANHQIVPLIKKNSISKKNIEFVGPICESTCKFIKYKNYPKIYENDFVAILDVGAYGSTLSSNYNTRPLPTEIIVEKNKFKVVRKRQSIAELIKN
tara:strand:+ start:152 stop:1381 length:1230 start_codon:yes stop_codon:yes gene_type:complete